MNRFFEFVFTFRYYLIFINVFTFLVYGIDKLKAKHDKWRIRESYLIGLAAIGGSIGALSAIYCFHHKTKHIKFTIGVPLLLILQIILILLLY